MNANSTATNSWPVRLQNGSVYLRNIFLVSAVVFAVVGMVGFSLNLAHVYPQISFLSNGWTLTDAVECWFAYKLFSYYVRGDWFAPRAVRWMQAIGGLSLLRGGWYLWSNLYARLHDGYFYHLQNSPLIVQAVLYAQFTFSQLLHNLVFGRVILFIAGIMDEGRKIQEEQELTV